MTIHETGAVRNVNQTCLSEVDIVGVWGARAPG